MRVLVIGIGSMGLNHLRVLTQLRSEGLVDEVYAADIDRERLGLARDAGADQVFTDVGEALKYRPDLGIVAVPTKLHYKIAKDLIKHMDLLIEKPVTETLDEALELYHEARRLGRRVLVGHIERFNPAYRALIDEVGGEGPVYMESIRVGPLRGDPSTYGNVLLDLGIHDVDLVMGLMHEDRVEIVGKVLRGEPVRSAWAMIKIGEAVYTMHVSWDYSVRVRRLTVMLRDRHYYVDLLNRTLLRDGTRLAVKDVDQLRQELVHTINVVRGLEKPLIDIVDGIRALAVVDGILRGWERVNLNEVLKL